MGCGKSSGASQPTELSTAQE
jgi:uncharacterized protein VirK/YbjX